MAYYLPSALILVYIFINKGDLFFIVILVQFQCIFLLNKILVGFQCPFSVTQNCQSDFQYLSFKVLNVHAFSTCNATVTAILILTSSKFRFLCKLWLLQEYSQYSYLGGHDKTKIFLLYFLPRFRQRIPELALFVPSMGFPLGYLSFSHNHKNEIQFVRFIYHPHKMRMGYDDKCLWTATQHSRPLFPQTEAARVVKWRIQIPQIGAFRLTAPQHRLYRTSWICGFPYLLFLFYLPQQ